MKSRLGLLSQMSSLILALFAFSPLALAQTAQTEESRARYYIDETFYNMQNIMPGCFGCSVAQAGEASPSAACHDYYSDIYSKPVVDFRFVFGYIDIGTPPIAADGPMRAAMIDRILKPCGYGEVGTCGFQQTSEDDADLFHKEVKGPDGQMHRVNLTLASSSASLNERENTRGALAAAQASVSERAETAFFDGVRSADLVTYVGHARDGGGPDFRPPIRRTNGSVNYNHYTSGVNKNRMLEALGSSARPPRAVGLFACYSGQYFASQTRQASRNRTAVAASDHSVHIDAAFTQGIAFLDSHLSMRCEGELREAMNATKETLSHERIVPPQMLGFFEPIPEPQAPVPYVPRAAAPAPVQTPIEAVVPTFKPEPAPAPPPSRVRDTSTLTDRIRIAPVPSRTMPSQPGSSRGDSAQ